MKKVLLTTSALAGASLMAAAPAQAEAPVMTFSGALAYEVVMFGGDQKAPGTGTNITANEQQSEFVWDARGSADNGLNYRANVQWRWAGNGAGAGAFDEAWLDFTGGFGRVYIGQEDGVSDLVAGTSGHSVQVGTWGTDGNNALRHVNFVDIGNTTLHYYQSHAGMTSDANKIGYVTPNFAGFSAGISYSPNSSSQQQAGSDNDSNADAIELAAGWSGSFGDVSLGIDGSYGWADDDAGGTVTTTRTDSPNGGAVTSTQTTAGDQESVGAYMIGGSIGFAGFSLAAAYLDNDDSGCATAVANCDAGDGYNVGASYNFGPGGVSIMWQESEDDTDGNGQEDESSILHAGVNYNIAEGLSTHLNAYWFDLENESGSNVPANSNDATVVILGTRMTF